MHNRSRLVLGVSVLLSGMPLVAESAPITQDPTSNGPTITIGTPLAVNPLIPLTNDGTITITPTPSLTTNPSGTSHTTNSVEIDGSPILIDGASISPSTAPTPNGPSPITVTGTAAGVPEPGSWLLLSASLLGLAGLRRTLSKS